MKYKVDKFELPDVGVAQVTMPEGTKVVGVCRVKDRIFLQGLCPVVTTGASESRTFATVYQGDVLDATILNFVGSFSPYSASTTALAFRWLVFEIDQSGSVEDAPSFRQTR